MSQVRVHNFSISLDGFGTGEGMTFEAPFGHAGHRLHEWMFATRFGRREILGESDGTEGIDHVMADQFGPGIGAEIMGAGKFGPPGWQDDPEMARVVGRQPTVPHADVRPDPQSAPVAGDGRWYDVPFPERRASGCTRSGARRSRGSGCPHWRGPDHDARVHRRRARRPPSRRAGSDPARPRRSALGRTGGVGAALRPGGSLVTQRRHPPDLHAPITDPVTNSLSGTVTVGRPLAGPSIRHLARGSIIPPDAS